MKVIAKVDSDKYICEVDHAEIEKFMDLYYGKMKKLNVLNNEIFYNFYKCI